MVDVDVTYRCDICREPIPLQDYIDQVYLGKRHSMHWPMSRNIIYCETCGLRIDRYVLSLRAEALEERKKKGANVGKKQTA